MMKWIFAGLVVTAAASASNVAQLEIATEEDMKRFDVISNAIDAGSYRDKTLACAFPEWADQAFIEECIEWAVKGCNWVPGNPNDCKYDPEGDNNQDD
ncbi:MAG: hypothetical protein V7751_06405 [Pseudoalteromonas distincta]